MSVTARVQDAIRASGLIGPTSGVLALLSGGADSVCLTHALREVVGPERLHGLHVNHGLRPAAAEDERFCIDLCEALGVPLAVEGVELPEDGNVEAAAREARYEAAERVRAREGVDLIATAHTASDQAETVLYRLACSPGRRALLGMAARNGRLVRPLLAVSGGVTRDYCRELGLEWREDETNADRRLARNRLRLDVLPALRSINTAAERNVQATADQLREESELLDGLVDDALERLATPGRTPAVDASRLRELAAPLRRLVLRRLAEQAAGQPLALRSAQVDEIERLAARGGSAAIDVGAGVRAVCEYGVLRFKREAVPAVPQEAALAVPGHCHFGDWELVCELGRGDAGLGSSDEPVLDADRLASVLTVRSWREGDRMRPLGLAGTKSLQDLFTDRKVPRSVRRLLPVVESDGEIAWVAGVAVSERFKVGPRTERSARLRALQGRA